MTYKSALDWAENHLPMINYDDFDDWYDAIDNNFGTPALTDSSEFYRDARDLWEDSIGEIQEQEDYDSPIPNEQELPSRGRGIEVEQGVIITNHGAEPVKVVSADNKPIQQDIQSSDIVITESASTHQQLPPKQVPQQKQSFRNRFTSAFKSLGGLFRRKK